MERTNKIRANQAMTSRVADTSTGVVGASGMETVEVVVESAEGISGRE
jgi:hypothetical protein